LNHRATDAVFYHIYPLGLCGAPARNDFAAAPLERLDTLLPWLDHAGDLGATALYLGPVFESSAHGYDTADFWHVDRRLGTDETLVRLVDAAHARGLRVVLDGVFNHVGRDFWAFRDVLANGPASEFRGWFAGLRFDTRSPFGDPFAYEGWSGHFDLVKLDLSNPDVRNHLLGAVRSWIVDFGIDGLRLDAADVVDLGFQRELAAWCRSLDPDFWLLGEIVHGDYRRWVNPETLDSVTNYECHKGLWSSLVDHNYFEIAYALNRQFGPGGMYAGLPLYNFADNHDQDRVASRLPEARLLYPLHLLLFTMPGVPSIYYGSEWGLRGRRAPGDDGPVRPALELPVDHASVPEPALGPAIRRLAALRASLPELRRGEYRQLHVAAEQLVFARAIDGRTAVVAINAADRPATITLPAGAVGDGEWADELNGGEWRIDGTTLRLEIPASWGRVLVRRDRDRA
jgi:cyclomaltodextrinase